MPQMFQMMHLRSWASEAATSKPEWGYFIWLSQQYLSGLIGFTFFLLTQCMSRDFHVGSKCAWLTIELSSRSSIENIHHACVCVGGNDEP
jgi:hypothetical protein